MQQEKSWLNTASLIVLAFTAIAFILNYTQTVLLPFVLSIFIVTLVAPLVDIQVLRWKWPRWLAVILSLVVVFILIAVLCLVITVVVQKVVATAGDYRERFIAFARQILDWLQTQGFELDTNEILTALQNSMMKMVSRTFGTAVNLLSSFFLVTIFVVFLLSGRNPHLVRRGIYADIDSKVRKYIATKVMISLVTGLLVWGVLAVIGLELAFVFGVMAFLLNFIPSIGSIIATFLPVPIAVAQFTSPAMMILAVLLPGAVQIFIGNVVEPKIMGSGLNLHPVTILLSLAFWSLLWGPVGMFLAAPMTAVIRIVLMQFETLRPLALIMAGQMPQWEEKEKVP